MERKRSIIYQALLVICIQSTTVFAIHDAIILIDREEKEKIKTKDRALTSDLIIALQSNAAPIIVSSNVLKIIMELRQKIGEDNLKKLRELIETTTDETALTDLAVDLLAQYQLDNDGATDVSILSLINFDSKNIGCYLHKSASLALLIPKKYILENKSSAANLSSLDQAQACGFNSSQFTPIDLVKPEHALEKLKGQKSSSGNKTQLINNLTASFQQKKDAEEKWVFYFSGHGEPARLGKDGKIMRETAHVAGLLFNEFKNFIEFCNKNLNVGFMHYNTCFGGGSNQAALNQTLSALNAQFILSAEGSDETSTYTNTPTFIPFDNRLILSNEPLRDFFKLVNLFIDKPKEFVQLKGPKTDPFVKILRTIVPEMTETNQPSIRFPSAGVFKALALENSAKVLTQSIVTAHEIEKRPINLADTEVIDLIIYPFRINVPLNLGKKIRSIVFPTTKIIEQNNETVHVFENVIFENKLQELLFALTYRNARFHKQTVIIKKLTGILYESSDLPAAPAINNLIVQIQGILGTNPTPPEINDDINAQAPIRAQDIKTKEMGGNVYIAFELHGAVYEKLIPVKNFEIGLDEEGLFNQKLYDEFNTISFTGEQVTTTNMEKVAEKFLTSQEVGQMKKPITLDGIIKQITAKMNR
jgi:hypothetical protein